MLHIGLEELLLHYYTLHYNIDASCNTDHPSALPEAPFNFSPITSVTCRLPSKT